VTKLDSLQLTCPDANGSDTFDVAEIFLLAWHVQVHNCRYGASILHHAVSACGAAGLAKYKSWRCQAIQFIDALVSAQL